MDGPLRGVFLHDVSHGLSQEELPLLQLVVGSDDDGCVHVNHHEVHDDNEDDEDDSGNLWISVVHLRIGELSKQHLEAGDRSRADFTEDIVMLPKWHVCDYDEHWEHQQADGWKHKDVCHWFLDCAEQNPQTGQDIRCN